MKKHDEGYVLAFVLVVMIVLCLVALSIMSISLRNLQNQQASIQRMEDKYAAQGAIEKVVAELSELTFEANETIENTLESNLCTLTEDESGNTLITLAKDESGNTLITLAKDESGKSFTTQCTFVATHGTSQITCGLKLLGKIESDTATVNEVTYLSYEISTVETEGGDTE